MRLYKFNELSEDAKQDAANNICQLDIIFDSELDDIYDELSGELNELGFDTTRDDFSYVYKPYTHLINFDSSLLNGYYDYRINFILSRLMLKAGKIETAYQLFRANIEYRLEFYPYNFQWNGFSGDASECFELKCEHMADEIGYTLGQDINNSIKKAFKPVLEKLQELVCNANQRLDALINEDFDVDEAEHIAYENDMLFDKDGNIASDDEAGENGEG